MSNSGKRYTAEQIIHILREIDVLSSNGHSLQIACKQAASSDPMNICFEKALAEYKKENKGEEPSEDSSKWMWNHCAVELESGTSE